MTYYLVGLITAAPWIVKAVDLVKVAMQADFLCPHLDKNGGFGFVRERVVKFVDMSIEDYAISLSIAAVLAFLVQHASAAIPPTPGPSFSSKAVNLSFAGREQLW